MVGGGAPLPVCPPSPPPSPGRGTVSRRAPGRSCGCPRAPSRCSSRSGGPQRSRGRSRPVKTRADAGAAQLLLGRGCCHLGPSTTGTLCVCWAGLTLPELAAEGGHSRASPRWRLSPSPDLQFSVGTCNYTCEQNKDVPVQIRLRLMSLSREQAQGVTVLTAIDLFPWNPGSLTGTGG